MAGKISQRAKKAKKTGKGSSGLHTVKALKRTKEDVVTAARKYGKKYAKKPTEKGKAFVREVRHEPGKVIEDAWESGKEFVGDLKDDPRSVVDEAVGNGMDFIEDVGQDIKDSFKGTVETGKAFLGSLEKDLRTVSGDIAEKIGAVIDKNETAGEIKTAISKKMKTVPGSLNMATKKDINILRKEIKALNAKIDQLSKT